MDIQDKAKKEIKNILIDNELSYADSLNILVEICKKILNAMMNQKINF